MEKYYNPEDFQYTLHPTDFQQKVLEAFDRIKLNSGSGAGSSAATNLKVIFSGSGLHFSDDDGLNLNVHPVDSENGPELGLFTKAYASKIDQLFNKFSNNNYYNVIDTLRLGTYRISGEGDYIELYNSSLSNPIALATIPFASSNSYGVLKPSDFETIQAVQTMLFAVRGSGNDQYIELAGLGGDFAIGSLLPATSTTIGLMSSSDKQKLDSLSTINSISDDDITSWNTAYSLSSSNKSELEKLKSRINKKALSVVGFQDDGDAGLLLLGSAINLDLNEEPFTTKVEFGHIPLASSVVNGLMSKEDKEKFDGIDFGTITFQLGLLRTDLNSILRPSFDRKLNGHALLDLGLEDSIDNDGIVVVGSVLNYTGDQEYYTKKKSFGLIPYASSTQHGLIKKEDYSLLQRFKQSNSFVPSGVLSSITFETNEEDITKPLIIKGRYASGDIVQIASFPFASQDNPGLMSMLDKEKLDNLELSQYYDENHGYVLKDKSGSIIYKIGDASKDVPGLLSTKWYQYLDTLKDTLGALSSPDSGKYSYGDISEIIVKLTDGESTFKTDEDYGDGYSTMALVLGTFTHKFVEAGYNNYGLLSPDHWRWLNARLNSPQYRGDDEQGLWLQGPGFQDNVEPKIPIASNSNPGLMTSTYARYLDYFTSGQAEYRKGQNGGLTIGTVPGVFPEIPVYNGNNIPGLLDASTYNTIQENSENIQQNYASIKQLEFKVQELERRIIELGG